MSKSVLLPVLIFSTLFYLSGCARAGKDSSASLTGDPKSQNDSKLKNGVPDSFRSVAAHEHLNAWKMHFNSKCRGSHLKNALDFMGSR